MVQFLRKLQAWPALAGGLDVLQRTGWIFAAACSWSLKALAGATIVGLAGFSTQLIPPEDATSTPDGTFTPSIDTVVVTTRLEPAPQSGVTLLLHRSGEHAARPVQRTLILHDASKPDATTSFRCLRFQPIAVEYSGRLERVFLGSHDGGLYLLGSDDGEFSLQKFGQHEPAAIRRILLSPDHRRLASASCQQVQVWDVPNCRLREQQAWRTAACGWLSFWRGSQHLIFVERDGTIRQLDLKRGESVDLPARPEGPQAVAVSPREPLLATVESECLCISDLQSGELLWQKPLYKSISPYHVAFSPSGRLVAVTQPSAPDRFSIRVYDAAEGRIQGELAGHTGRLRGVRFCSEDQLYSWSGDGTVRLWDVVAQQEIRCLRPEQALAQRCEYLD